MVPPCAATINDTGSVWPTVAVALPGSVVIESPATTFWFALLNGSAMYTVPLPSTATPLGNKRPDEANVITVFEDLTHFLIALLFVSARYSGIFVDFYRKLTAFGITDVRANRRGQDRMALS